MKAELIINVWAVYDHPRDFPTHFVARRHAVYRGIGTLATYDHFTANSLEEIRRKIPSGLHRLPRERNDDSKIVEVWL